MFLRGDGEIIALSGGTPRVRGFTSDGAALPPASFSFPSTGINGTPAGLLPLPGGGGLLLTTTSVYKFLPNGAFDGSFGAGGGFTFPTVNNNVAFRAHEFAAAPGGTVYVTGAIHTFTTGVKQPAVARLTSAGALDGTFGSGGTATLSGLSNGDEVRSVAVDAAGRPVVAGKDAISGGARGVVARLTTAGAADSTFDGDGYRQFLPPAGHTATAGHVRFDSGGRIVISGYYQNSSTQLVASFLARLAAGGALDGGFAGDGVQETLLPPGAGVEVWPGPHVVDAAGNVVMGIGTRPVLHSYGDSVLFRITPSGQRDTTFGTPGGNGTTVVGFSGPSDSRAQGAVRQPDGKLVFVGLTQGGASRWVIGRLNADGSPDTGFGAGGAVEIDWGTLSQFPNDVKVDALGRIVIAGWLANSGATDEDIALARLTPSGQLDGTFGAGGLARLSVPGTDEVGIALDFQSDGKILVGGLAEGAGKKLATVFRFGPGGTLDGGFGSGGRRVIDPAAVSSNVTGIFALPGGGILATGGEETTATEGRAFAARLDANGAPDPTFGQGGTGIAYPPSGSNTAVDARGRIYSAGVREEFVGGTRRYAVHVSRLTPAGAPDTSFGAGGTAKVPLRGDRDVLGAIAVDPIGRLILAIEVRTGSTPNTTDVLVVRLHGNGQRDTTFGSGGERQVDVAGRFDRPSHVAFTGDGKLLVLGDSSTASTGIDFSAVRLTNPTGDGTAPRMIDAAHAYDARPPSLRLTFSEDIAGTVESTDFVLINPATGQPVGGSLTVSYDSTSRQVEVTYTQQPGALPDGNYRLLLPAGAVGDAALTPTVEDFTFDFYVLGGDINRDRAVNGSDFAILAGNFGRSGVTFAQGDLNGDGRVDGSDFAILAGNFGKSVPEPQPAPAVAAPAASSALAAPAAAKARRSPAPLPAPVPAPRRRVPPRPRQLPRRAQ
jgi:uncharacterized delta-60 repeat protein